MRRGATAVLWNPRIRPTERRNEGVKPFAILAGPFAARLLGHSCGWIDFAPASGIVLTLLGPPAIAWAVRGKSRRLRFLGLALWLPAWLATGLLSVINTLE